MEFPDMLPSQLPYVKNQHYVNHLPVTKGFYALSCSASVSWTCLLGDQRTLVLKLRSRVASLLVWNGVAHIAGNGSKPSPEKLTCQEMMTGGSSYSLMATQGLKQLLAFDVLAGDGTVPLPVAMEAVCYSWAEIRCGIVGNEPYMRSLSDCCLCVHPWDMRYTECRRLGSQLYSC